MKIGSVDIGAAAKETFKEFREDDLQGLAAEVAYHFLFSVVPLLIFLTALSGFVSRLVGVDDAMSSITDWLFTDSGLPADAASAIQDPLREVITNQSGGFLSIGALLALWSGKNAIAAFMKALNVAFDVEETRPWWKKTAIAMGLTVALGLALVAASSIFLAGSFVGEGLADRLGLGSTWTTIWMVLRWILIPAVAMVAVAFFYWVGPDVDAPFKWLTPGSVVAVVLWGAATFGLGIYFQYGAGALKTYGVLGAVLAFVFWLYVMSFILLFGGELNSVIARANDPAVQAQVADPAKQGSAVGAKRRRGAGVATGAGGSAAASPAPPPSPSLPPLSFPAAALLPSAERQAHAALAAEGSDARARRFRSAVAALGTAVVAAVSGVLVGSRRR